MNIIVTVVICIAGILAGYIASKLIQKKKVGEYQSVGRQILEEAKKEADVVKREASIQAKDIVIQARNELEQEVKAKKGDLQNMERRLSAERIKHRQEDGDPRQEGRGPR